MELEKEKIYIEPSICYEAIFQTFNNKKIDLFINITNDAWFGNTIGPIQHFQYAKIRAVEFGIPVIRVANTGYSGLIGPYGKVLKKGIIKINDEIKF